MKYLLMFLVYAPWVLVCCVYIYLFIEIGKDD